MSPQGLLPHALFSGSDIPSSSTGTSKAGHTSSANSNPPAAVAASLSHNDSQATISSKLHCDELEKKSSTSHGKETVGTSKAKGFGEPPKLVGDWSLFGACRALTTTFNKVQKKLG